MSIEIISISIFLILNLLIGLYFGKEVRTIQDYSLGNRKFDTLSIAATIVATYISGDLFLAYVSATYKDGLFFIIAALSGVICLLIIGWLFAPKMKEFFGTLSVAETMGKIYGTEVRIITAISSILVAVGMTAVQIKVLSTVFSCFFDIPSLHATLISSSVVIIYSAFGGIRSVIFTDIMQFFAFSVFIPMFALFLWQKFSGFNLVLNVLANNPLFDYKQLFDYKNPKLLPNLVILLWCLIPSLNSTIFQRILIAADIQQVRKSFTLAAFLSFIILSIICFIGTVMVAYMPGLDPDNAVIHTINNSSFLWLKILALIGIIAMAMSTADSWINSTAVIFTNDLWNLTGKKIENELLIPRISTVLIGALAVILATQAVSLFKLVLLTANFYMPIVDIPLVLTILGFRTGKRPILFGMLVGFVIVIIWRVYITPYTEIESVVPAMFANLITMLLTHYFLKEPGGWITNLDDCKKSGIVAKRQKLNWNQTSSNIKNFQLLKYLEDNTPRNEKTFLYFALGTLLTLIGSILLDQHHYLKHAHLVNFLQSVILLIASIFIFFRLWPGIFKEKYISFIWYLSVFLSLGFISISLLLISELSQIQLLISLLNFIIIGLLVQWVEALIFMMLSVLLALIAVSLLDIDISLLFNTSHLALKLFSLILVSSLMQAFFIKPLRDRLKDESLLKQKFEKLYLALETSYAEVSRQVEHNSELKYLLEQQEKYEKKIY